MVWLITILFSAGISPLSCNYCFADALYRWVVADSAPGLPYWDVPVFLAQFPIFKEASDWTHKPFLHEDFDFFFYYPPPCFEFSFSEFIKIYLPLSVFSPGSHLLGNHSLFIYSNSLPQPLSVPITTFHSLLSYLIDLLDKLTIGVSFKCGEHSLSPVMNCILMSLNTHWALNF